MLGIDLVAVDRISRLSCRKWFTSFWLHPEELAYISSKPRPDESLAAAVAAKEAVMKASGQGFQQGLVPLAIRLDWTAEGAPRATLNGASYQLSLTHSDGFAAAVAVQMAAES